MKTIGILFPHQLFEDNPLIPQCDTIYLIEEYLYFRQYTFHKQKISFHRASMKAYTQYLESLNIRVIYIDAFDTISDIRQCLEFFGTQGIQSFEYIDTTDNWLESRITKTCNRLNISPIKHQNPSFINSIEEITTYFQDKKRMFQTDFYTYQRKKSKILMDNDQKPIGGKWTYDSDNRLKYPKDKQAPQWNSIELTDFHKEAYQYTQKNFLNNYGQLNPQFAYPITHTQSKQWLEDFLVNRLTEFGPYEDAIVSDEYILHHSLLSPLLNTGLLTPQYVIDQALIYENNHHIPLNSLEGFIRQIIGWREFIRAVYELKGNEERTKNFWKFHRKIPESFWSGNTRIEPIDNTIHKVLQTGYCHHIERLMILGNFMLLCEFDPDEVYRWFMELFIDAYDWVMVPNIYGMSQFADGGLMATKPYISGSNYIMKMSNYTKGEWQDIWNGLFWRFIHTHREFFLHNPRLSLMIKSFDKMSSEKRQNYIHTADRFLESLG
jgi:deoxyribodipyrimidine photolyase-related protein